MTRLEFSKSVPATFLAVAQRQPEHVAIVASEGGELSYGLLARRVEAVAGGLKGLGIKQRDRIAILSENRPEWAISYLAIQAAGATVLPLDVLLKPEEHQTLLSVGKPSAFFISKRFYPSLRETLSSTFPDIRIILLDDDNSDDEQVFIESLYDSEPYLCETIDPGQPASLIFTSGTTGTPKAVILTHRNLQANIKGIFAGLNFHEQDRFLSLLPLSHVYECTTGFLTPLIAGATIIYARSLAANQVVEDLRNHRITILIGVPLLFEKMVRGMKRNLQRAPKSKQNLFNTFYSISSLGRKLGASPGKVLFKSLRAKAGMRTLRMMVSGGAPLDPAIAEFYATLGFDFLQGYGMTECSPVISVNFPDKNRIGSVGPALEGIEIRIDNPNAQGIGEILVAGESVTPGYLDDDEKTRSVIRDGWLCTGDLGRLDRGFLYICGRAKNLIVSAGGKNIYPEEIEIGLLENDFIAEALILGRPLADKQGEKVCALIYPDLECICEAHPECESAKPDSDSVRKLVAEVVSDVNQRMADYKKIVDWEIVPEEFEKTSSKKIKRTLYK